MRERERERECDCEELGVDGQMEFGLKFLDERGFVKNKMISGCFLFSFLFFLFLRLSIEILAQAREKL